MKKMNLLPVLLLLAAVSAGCAEAVTVAGNGLSMIVAVALLWSTVNLNRNGSREE